MLEYVQAGCVEQIQQSGRIRSTWVLVCKRSKKIRKVIETYHRMGSAGGLNVLDVKISVWMTLEDRK